MMHARRALPAALLIAALAASSCATRVVRPIDTTPPAPIPNSPANVLRLLEWCYDYRSIAMHRTLFTADYRFLFSPLDSAGSDYRGVPWTRDDEIIYFTHLVHGGSGEAPAAFISLRFDENLLVMPDVRYPWDAGGRWHKSVRTQVLLNIRTSDGNAVDISGAARFYFVRGDSAAIPSDLGAGPDSTRWYIQRWDDETIQPSRLGVHAQPASSRTWGSIKVLYH